PAYVLVSIDKNYDHRQFATRVHQVAGLYPLPAEESRYRMQHACSIRIFLAKIIEDRQMQRLALPSVGFIQINRDLHCHRHWHSTAPVPAPFLRAPPLSTADYSKRNWRPSSSIVPARSRP